MTPNLSVGTRLREARLAANLTRDRLAVNAEVGSATVTRIENGRSSPNRATMRALAAALGVPVDDLFNDNGRAANASVGTSEAVDAGPCNQE